MRFQRHRQRASVIIVISNLHVHPAIFWHDKPQADLAHGRRCREAGELAAILRHGDIGREGPDGINLHTHDGDLPGAAVEHQQMFAPRIAVQLERLRP